MTDWILGFGIFMLGCGIGFLLGMKARNKKLVNKLTERSSE